MPLMLLSQSQEATALKHAGKRCRHRAVMGGPKGIFQCLISGFDKGRVGISQQGVLSEWLYPKAHDSVLWTPILGPDN